MQALKVYNDFMNYEEMSRGDENPYQSGKDGYITEAEEDEANNAFNDWAYHDALKVIEEANVIVKNVDDYADLVAANASIIEYREVVFVYETNHNTKLVNRIKSLENIIIDLANKVSESISNIPISEKKLITVKELEELYSFNEEAQRKLRGRHHDPLPHEQHIERGKIFYDIKKIDKWRENYEK